MKKIVFYLHLYVGLVSALFLIVLSLSGTIIAFEPELNRAFHPELTLVQPTATPLNWDAFRTHVEQQSPGWKLIRIYFPDAPDRSTYVRLRNTGSKKIRHVYVNQYTGQVLGSTEDGSNWIIKTHDLHVNLMTARTGNWFVTAATYCLLALSLSGIVLWWPRRLFRIQKTKPPARLNRELHYMIGFWSSLAMFLFAVTGLSLHYQTGKLLDLLNNKPSTFARSPGHGTSLEGMLQTARETLPGTEIPRLLLSEKAGDPVFLYQRFPEDKTPAGRSFTTLDPSSGAVLTFGSSRDMPFAQVALVQWTREIHTGTILGLPTQILASLFSLMLTALAITGPLIWWNKRQAAARGRKLAAVHTKQTVAS